VRDIPFDEVNPLGPQCKDQILQADMCLQGTVRLLMKVFCSLALALLCAAPVLADATVNAFALAATASPCSSQPIATMGCSIDIGSTTTTFSGNSTAATVSPHSEPMYSTPNRGEPTAPHAPPT
jgi:hypothetical protein